MLMNKEELEARELCASQNQVYSCLTCIYGLDYREEFHLSLKYRIRYRIRKLTKEILFPYYLCQEWRYWLNEFKKPLLKRFIEFLRKIWYKITQKFKKSDIKIWQIIYGKCSW